MQISITVPAMMLAISLGNSACADAHDTPASKWDLSALYRAPQTNPAPGFQEPGVRAVFFDGPTFQGKPTRVFAWIGIPAHEHGTKVPGMVLVHGGGGTAFAEWVRRWTDRGYAAIAMDLNGEVPTGTYNNWTRHEWAGPAGSAAPGNSGFDQIEWPITDQWCYHAVADVILANSLLRSFPDVDARRIGVTGVSWGGFLTCIVAGVDSRFRFAAPVYGCGFLGDDSAWTTAFHNMGADRARKWLDAWDPAEYLPRARMPMLWLSGTNDFAYPLSSLQKSYRLSRGTRTIVLRVRMPHNHGPASEGPEEIRVLADAMFRGGSGLARIVRQGSRKEEAWVSYRSRIPIQSAELLYTCDAGAWQEREWHQSPAAVDSAAHRITATIPVAARVYCFNLIDALGCIVSSEHIDRTHQPGADHR